MAYQAEGLDKLQVREKVIRLMLDLIHMLTYVIISGNSSHLYRQTSNEIEQNIFIGKK